MLYRELRTRGVVDPADVVHRHLETHCAGTLDRERALLVHAPEHLGRVLIYSTPHFWWHVDVDHVLYRSVRTERTVSEPEAILYVHEYDAAAVHQYWTPTE